MPIARFIDKNEYDSTNPNHFTGDCNGDGEYTWYAETYAHGLVVSEHERNMYHDSDFFATYYDQETDTFKTVEYASTRGWCYPLMGLTKVDATPEVFKLYDDRIKESEKIRREEVLRFREAKKPHTVSIGSTVKVFKGRKVPVGLIGQVSWLGTCKYSGKVRIGITTQEGDRVFIALSNCKVVHGDVELTPINDAEIPYQGKYSIGLSGLGASQRVQEILDNEQDLREKALVE